MMELQGNIFPHPFLRMNTAQPFVTVGLENTQASKKTKTKTTVLAL